jgi:hypothetical protein
MSNQISVPRTGRLIDVAAIVAALRRRLLAQAAPARPTWAPAEGYFERGLMKRELHRL